MMTARAARAKMARAIMARATISNPKGSKITWGRDGLTI
jgi:hypothetical protein